jgi:16S rRNA (adenine1518-N6/adenine1519-N6)-dimethyltransferase
MSDHRAPYEHRDPRTVLKVHDLWAKKHFGQNFLVAPGAPERIAAAGGAGPNDIVFEIGAGCGTLTRALAARAGRVIALEHDRDLVPVARAEVAAWPGAEVREGNVLDMDWPALAAEVGGAPFIYGNLPYHLSTPILLALLEAPESWTRACFLLQREFAERVAAAPGTRECGTLSAYAALLTRPRIAFGLPGGAFHPPPKVESAVLVLERLPAPAADVGDQATFRQVVRALFAQRRKTARNALRAACPEPEAALLAAGLAPERRGETFTLVELAALSRAVLGLRRD